jgi:thioesterase domain-containing protein
MEVAVVEISERHVTLAAPLAPNINHRLTVFGGSASAVAILAAWSLLHTRLQAAGAQARLVIQRNTMSYEVAIAGPFTATARVPGAEAWTAFLHMLNRKGKARVDVESVLDYEGRVAARFEGTFVALGSRSA